MSYINSLKLNNVDYTNTDSSCRLVNANSQKKILTYLNTNDEILDIQDPEIVTLFLSKRDLEYKQIQLNSDIKNIYNNLPQPCNHLENDRLCNINIETRDILDRKKKELRNNDKTLQEITGKILVKTKLYVKTNRQLENLDFYNNPYSYDNTDFWNTPFDYDNLVDENGNILKLVGVCNPLLFNNCDNVTEKDIQPMNGVCKGYSREENINIDHNIKNSSYKKINFFNNNLFLDDTSDSQSYKEEKVTFTKDLSYKLPKNSLISDSIIDKNQFSRLYCKSGKMIQKDEQFFCN